MKHSDIPHKYDCACRCVECVSFEFRLRLSIKSEAVKGKRVLTEKSSLFKSFCL
jgi:hypothetical protein